MRTVTTTARRLTRSAPLCCAGLCSLLACFPDMGAALVDEGDAAGGDADVPPDNSELIAEGEVVFRTAYEEGRGNVGCQYCHCPDATGGCQFDAPRIIGKSRGAIADALQTVEEMQVLNLSEHEIDAVAAYLAYLATQ